MLLLDATTTVDMPQVCLPSRWMRRGRRCMKRGWRGGFFWGMDHTLENFDRWCDIKGTIFSQSFLECVEERQACTVQHARRHFTTVTILSKALMWSTTAPVGNFSNGIIPSFPPNHRCILLDRPHGVCTPNSTHLTPFFLSWRCNPFGMGLGILMPIVVTNAVHSV